MDNGGPDDRLVARRAEMYRLYIGGMPQAQLAERFSVSRGTVSNDLAEHRKTIPPATAEAIRKDHIEQIERIKRTLIELVEMEGAPVTSGKDGLPVMDPVTCAPVRDYSLRVQASRELLKLLEREAKQLGSDAAAKVEHSGQVEVVDSVNAELARLADSIGLQGPVQPEISAAESRTQ
jgi:hypothetical protein